MKRFALSRGRRSPGWQSWVCILLIGLVLYNPFSGLLGSNDGFCYDRMARNRATVGASELQHFSPVTSSIAQTEIDVDVPATDLIPAAREEYTSPELQEMSPRHAEFVIQLSNRPPPSL